MKRIRFRHIMDGEVIESELVIARADRGETLPDECSSKWCKVQDGPRLFALRLGGIPVLREHSTSEPIRLA
jgi:hypothetical protein